MTTEKLRMPKEKYLQTQMLIIQIAQVVNQLDLESFLTTISTAEAVAPVIDPTLQQRAGTNLDAIKKLASSLQPVKAASVELFRSIIMSAAQDQMKEKPREP